MSGGHTFFSATLGKKPLFLRHLLDRISFHKADALCAVSGYVAERTRELLNLGDTEITVLPNPVNTEQFKPQPEIEEVPGSILFVGTVTEKKGIRQLVQAMPKIISAVPDAKMFIVGRDTIDPKTKFPYSETLKSLVPGKILESIHFIGAVKNEEIAGWISRSQVCVYPSHMEAQGIVVIEGMACGKAVVASKLGPGPELIAHGVHGLLCDPYSPDDIAAKVIRVLTDGKLRESLGRAARIRAVSEFSLNHLIDKNISFYNELYYLKTKKVQS
jgi:glycosyltransferase involved in cell wall biosynthesis